MLHALAFRPTPTQPAPPRQQRKIAMHETMILGAGPGGTGPLIWAASAGRLQSWLERGVVVIDQHERMGGTVGRYALNADTLGSTFLECLGGAGRTDGIVGLRDDCTAQALAEYRDSLPPLALVGHFLERLGEALAGELQRSRRSRFVGGLRVRALRLGRDGSVTAELSDGRGRRRWLQAASAVLALGGRQQHDWENVVLAPDVSLARWRDKLMPSDRLLTRGGALLAAARLARHAGTPRAVILGGSHSAFSAAWTLLEKLPGVAFVERGVQILHRSPPRVFYPSRQAAQNDGYAFAEADVCPATGRVHRLGGLRGDGRDLWRRYQGLDGSRGETRLAVQPIGALAAADIVALLDAADLIVPAFGYRLATVPVFAPDGSRVALARSGPSVDADARLRTEDGGALANVFGIGLGSGFRPWGTMAGEPGFRGQQNSLWLYQHGLGALVHDGVRQWAAQRRAYAPAAPIARRPPDLIPLEGFA